MHGEAIGLATSHTLFLQGLQLNHKASLLAFMLLMPVATATAPTVAHASDAETRCARLAKHFKSAKKLAAADGAKRLRSLHNTAPDCAAAPTAAYQHLMRHWGKAMPSAKGTLTRNVATKAWGNFQRTTRFVSAIVAFRRSGIRSEAAYALGELYEGMAIYFVRAGHVPVEMKVIRDVPQSLYHNRAVDLSEFLLLQAEESYDLALLLRRDNPPDDELLRKSAQSLRRLRQRYVMRAAEERKRRPAPAANR